MKKTDKQTLEMLRAEFSKGTEKVEVPLRLQKESVVTMLKESDKKTKDFSSETGNKRNNVVMLRRFAMAAAVFVVVIITVLYANSGGVKVIKTDNVYKSYNKAEPVEIAKDYNHIQKAVQEICNIKSAESSKPDKNSTNTLTSTNPQEQPVVGGYSEYVATAGISVNSEDIGSALLSEPNPGNKTDGMINADMVKTDGKYIYIVTSENNNKTIVEQIKIVNADSSQMKQEVEPIILSDGKNADFTDKCIEIYLKDNKLVALMSREGHQIDSEVLYNEKSTIAVIYDITDPTKPVEIRRHIQEGEYIASGLYGNNLRIITNKSISGFSQNAEIDMSKVIPSFSVNGKATKLSADEIFIAVNSPEASYLFITVTDISNPDSEAGRLAILGGGKYAYSLSDALVVARGFVSVDAEKNGEHSSLTEIYRVNISGTSIGSVASYVIEGKLISGSPIDEYNGYLRVAAEQKGTNNLYIFNEKMEFIRCLNGFFADKKVKRVKFIGERAYFITKAENGEEIWLVDISDPMKPAEGGMLPTEGFLQMLSPVSENIVLGVTEYPDDKNAFAGTKGKYFICDVSDVKNPVIISDYELGEGYSYPMSTDQRHAMLDTEKKIFASPVIYSDISNGKVLSIYLVFDISENEFNSIGIYEHRSEDGMTANRCVLIGDSFYTVSGGTIIAFSTEKHSMLSSVAIR